MRTRAPGEARPDRGRLDQRCDELAVTSALSRAAVLRTIRRNNHRETGELIDRALSPKS